MNRFKRIYQLSGVFLVLCLLTFCISQYEEYKEQIKNSGEAILELSSDEVTALAWQTNETSFAFHKDETWIYDEDETFPVDEDKINKLLSQFETFYAAFIIENADNEAQYGLDDPICTIQISTAKKDYEIKLGDYSTMDEQRYVSIGDGNVYLVQTDPLDDFDVGLSDLIKNDTTPQFDEVSRITFKEYGNYSIVYKENSHGSYAKEDVYFVEKDESDLPLDTSLVNSYLRKITNLDLSTYVTYNADDDILKTYGLKSPDLTVEVETEDETFSFSVGRNADEVAQAEDGAEVPAYIRINDSKIIYQISATTYDELLKVSYNSLRHEEVFYADFDDVEKIEITLEDSDYTLTAETEDDEKVWYYQGKECEIKDFEQALTALKADSFTTETAESKEEIRVTVYLDNTYFPKVEIILYRYDGQYCLAVVDGQSMCLVERSDVVTLIEAVNALVL